jgi:hypothetical protein
MRSGAAMQTHNMLAPEGIATFWKLLCSCTFSSDHGKIRERIAGGYFATTTS